MLDGDAVMWFMYSTKRHCFKAYDGPGACPSITCPDGRLRGHVQETFDVDGDIISLGRHSSSAYATHFLLTGDCSCWLKGNSRLMRRVWRWWQSTL